MGLSTAEWIIIIGCIIVIGGIFAAAGELEKRWNRMHPPDGWDGMREDKDDG